MTAQETPESRHPTRIKVFVVEDTPFGIAGLQRIIEETEDLEYAGSHDKNTPDLPDRVGTSEADVVIMDIVLGVVTDPKQIMREEERSGIKAIIAIRQKLGSGVKILGFSAYPQFRDRALEAGADAFILKGATIEEIRKAIRQVCRGQFENPGIGKIAGLELFLESRGIVVIGTHGRTEKIYIEPFPFAFLWYLAEERRQGQTGWVIKEEGKYKLRQDEQWCKICNQIGSTWAGRSQVEAPFVARWCAIINGKVKPYIEKGAQPLIKVPGPGHNVNINSYSLNSNITSENIIIH